MRRLAPPDLLEARSTAAHNDHALRARQRVRVAEAQRLRLLPCAVQNDQHAPSIQAATLRTVAAAAAAAVVRRRLARARPLPCLSPLRLRLLLLLLFLLLVEQ